MAIKAASRTKGTRGRIVDESLRLFNEFGEPDTTTSLIAAELAISPGNLYYHFRSKDEIVETLCVDFERAMESALLRPEALTGDVDEVWCQIRDTFDVVWRYRFLYRDLNNILTRIRTVEVLFRRILDLSVEAAAMACARLAEAGEMVADERERRALADNLVVVSSYWLSFEYARAPRRPLGEAALRRGAFQVLAVAAPYLRGRSRALYEKLAEEYRVA